MGSTLSKKQKSGLILFCVGTGFLIGRLYYNGKFNKEPEPQSKQEDSETYTQIQISNFPKDSVQVNEQLLQKAAKQIKVEFQGHLLSMNTIIQIFQRSIDLVKPEYREITLNNRECIFIQYHSREKRSKGKIQQFIVSIIENLIEKKQIDLCQYLQISEEVLQESAMSLEESGQYQQFVMIQATQRIQIKESIPNKKTLSVDDLKKVLSFQVQILNKKPKELVQMIQALSQANQYNQILIPMAINTILFDYCYDEFQIEEEDLMVMIQNQNIFADLKVQSLLQQLEMIIFQLMGVA
ncbi:unnamed protein product (macronuclear) [Paramecium tetraurelia]|uniref:Transmembrane protein n=1 Tax=Paramecium tetraurelia TaxID=5888 RepID=A0CMQ7_PARTE|nr:uncharacterized protein GSPATT00008553001 [Paramecium tetraurelia]CAK72074.1 unnamed protein product [Paramecium tetraurelia]|eukprot:XP_001439471.1 hypothetical protein (macronuclear) [Paramecium tetraurelia strain d4-2]